MKRFLSIIVLLSLASPCLSEITEYDIEIVIFEDITNRYLNSERWPRLEPDMPIEETSFEFFLEEDIEPAYPESNDVINISDSENRLLEDYATKINSSNRYNLLVHKLWRQTGLETETAINIKIDSRNETKYSDGSEINLIKLEQIVENEDQLKSYIKGDIKVILGRYLHIHTDLIYSKPLSSYMHSPIDISDAENPYKNFSIKTHRKMRSRNLHYIDHPLAGILVIATPVEQEAGSD